MKKHYRKIIAIILVCMCCLAVVSFMQGCTNAVKYPKGSFDFQYDSAKYILLGINPYTETLYPTGMQEKLGLDVFYDALEANQFPSMLLVLLPYAFFEPMVANWLWMLSNVFFSVGILVLVKKMFFNNIYQMWLRANERIALLFPEKDCIIAYMFFACMFFIGLPWRNNIGNGQHTIMAFFFFLLALYLSDMHKEWWAGVALAISFFKYTLTVPLALIFIHKKKYKELVVSVVLHIIGTLLSAVWLNASVIDLLVLPLKKSTGLATAGAYDIASIFKLSNWSLLISSILMVVLLLYVLVGKFKGSEEELFSLLIMLSLIIVYHREYDYFVLIIPLIVFGLKCWQTEIGRIGKWILFFDVIYVFVISRLIYGLGCDSRIFAVSFAVCFYMTIAMFFVALHAENKLTVRNRLKR